MTMPAPAPATETADVRYRGLDTWDDKAILTALLEGQKRGLNAVAAAVPAIARAAHLGAEALANGGRLIYLAAGSPALMSLSDALEVPATYGIQPDRIVLILSDGDGISKRLNGVREDDVEGARADVAAKGVGSGDCVVATSASGTTPYTVAGLEAARAAGATTVAIAGNAGALLLDLADVKVLLDTGPEVISGSTRMAAGTAQKATLNMLSTLIGVRLGHVYDGLMVNMHAENHKLHGRAARIVSTITEVESNAAFAALELSGGEIKPAILIAAGAGSLARASDLLSRTGGNVRDALDLLHA